MATSKIRNLNQQPEDSGWLTLTTGIRYRKKEGIVYLVVESFQGTQTSGTETIGTLPAGFRPGMNMQPFLRKGTTLLQSWITTAGAINIIATTSTTVIAGSCTFPADN